MSASLAGFQDRSQTVLAYPPQYIGRSIRSRTESDGFGDRRVAFTPCSSVSTQDACGRTRTYVVRGRLIYSQVLLLLGHARLKKIALKKRGRASV